jgi:hypothetical protein
MVHFRIDKSPRIVSVLSQLNPAHTLPSYFFNFNIIPLSTCRYFKWSLQARSLYSFLSSPMRVTCSSHLINYFLNFRIIHPVYFKTQSVSQLVSGRMIDMLLKWICKEVVVAYSRLHLDIRLKGVTVTTDDPCEENWCLGRDANQAPLECKPTPACSLIQSGLCNSEFYGRLNNHQLLHELSLLDRSIEAEGGVNVWNVQVACKLIRDKCYSSSLCYVAD